MCVICTSVSQMCQRAASRSTTGGNLVHPAGIALSQRLSINRNAHCSL